VKAEHIKTIVTTAAATAAIALAALWPAFLNGADDGNAVTPSIKTPRFVQGTVEFTLALPDTQQTFKAGDEPAFDLVAVNTGDQPATAAVEAVMMSTTVPPPRSRTPGRQMTVWHEPLTVVLGPHETKTFKTETNTAVPDNSKMSIYLHSVTQSPGEDSRLVSMLSFSTATDVQPSR